MESVIFIIQIIAAVFNCMAVLLSIPLFFAFRWPNWLPWIVKLYASALSSVFSMFGMLTTVVGITTGSSFLSVTGIYVALVFLVHFILVTRPPAVSSNFEQAFGPHWSNSIPPAQKTRFLSNRTKLRLPTDPKVRLQQNICFATIPDTQRSLLCDVWQPPKNVSTTGLAFIYLHGSAFYILDKDFSTRTFFSYLAAQGHVVMDVAYRLAPETDIMGMVHDAKRAIVWMKEHAAMFGVNARHIVIAGGSAGGHLALLTAYTSKDPEFTPEDLTGKNVDVCAVISLYGTTDLKALYYHTNQHLTNSSAAGRPKKAVPKKMPNWVVRSMGDDYHRLGFDKDFENTGALAPLLRGHPDECPERYAKFSPISHVHKECAPTLLIHGEHDILAPVTSTRNLYQLLDAAQVPTVLHILPQTDHGFDLVLPRIAPAAHNAYYDVERFLAVISVGTGEVETKLPATFREAGNYIE